MPAERLETRVLRALRSPFPAVRTWALTKLVNGSVRVEEDSFYRLIDDDDPAVRRQAVRAAGVTRSPLAVARLIPLLDSGDQDLALQAAVALAMIAGREPPCASDNENASNPAYATGMAIVSGCPAQSGSLGLQTPVAKKGISPSGLDRRAAPVADNPEPVPARSIDPLPGEPGFGADRPGQAFSLYPRVFIAVLVTVGAFLLGGVALRRPPRDEGRVVSSAIVRLLNAATPGERRVLLRILARMPIDALRRGDRAGITFEPGRVPDSADIAATSGVTPESHSGAAKDFVQGDTRFDGFPPGPAGASGDGTVFNRHSSDPREGPAASFNNIGGREPAKAYTGGVSRREQILLSTARRYLSYGRVEEALRICRKILDKNPDSKEALSLKNIARERFGVIE